MMIKFQSGSWIAQPSPSPVCRRISPFSGSSRWDPGPGWSHMMMAVGKCWDIQNMHILKYNQGVKHFEKLEWWWWWWWWWWIWIWIWIWIWMYEAPQNWQLWEVLFFEGPYRFSALNTSKPSTSRILLYAFDISSIWCRVGILIMVLWESPKQPSCCSLMFTAHIIFTCNAPLIWRMALFLAGTLLTNRFFLSHRCGRTLLLQCFACLEPSEPCSTPPY